MKLTCVIAALTIISILSILFNILFMNVIKRLRARVKALQPRYKLTRKQFNKLDYRSIDLHTLDSLDGIQFENLCCEILHELGYKNIVKTCATGDFGLDIICTKNKVRYGIQCKCYSSAVGVSAVQEAFAGSKYYKCDIAVVMSNEYFTDAAQELARTIGVTLWSRHFFVRELGNLKSCKSQKRRR